MRRPNKCFVIMPTGGRGEYKDAIREARFIYRGIICAAIEKKFGNKSDGAKEPIVPVMIQVDELSPGAITHDIIRNIAKSDLVIVDITGGNPNVFYELGVRHTLSPSSTILMCQIGHEIPFDIGSYSCIKYEPKLDGIEEAIKKLVDALDRVYSSPESPRDSLVFDALGNVSISFSDPAGGARFNEMTWSEYWAHLERIITLLREGFDRDKWFPDVFFGITNGGMIFGELIARAFGREQTPLLALWANRQRAKKMDYFSDSINIAMLEAIDKELKPDPGAGNGTRTALVLDDRIYTGATALAAIEITKNNLPNTDVRYLPMVSHDARYLARCRDHLIWKHQSFDLSDDEINQIHVVARDYFPYRKHIR
jgi:hypoxanthine phosphoribosyltransferase